MWRGIFDPGSEVPLGFPNLNFNDRMVVVNSKLFTPKKTFDFELKTPVPQHIKTPPTPPKAHDAPYNSTECHSPKTLLTAADPALVNAQYFVGL